MDGAWGGYVWLKILTSTHVIRKNGDTERILRKDLKRIVHENEQPCATMCLCQTPNPTIKTLNLKP